MIVWEAAANGLFGNSLTELSVPGGLAAQLRTGIPSPLSGVPATPGGLAASPDLLMQLYGAAALGPAAAAAQQVNGQQPPQPGAQVPGQPSGNGANQAARPANAADLARSANVQRFLDLAEQSGRPGTRIPTQIVGEDGGITIPYAGRIIVAGQTTSEVQHRIEQLLAPKALEPQALVVVGRSAVNSVSVAGEVVPGARVQLSPGGDRLLQVIAAAGGEKAPVHDTFVRLSRGGVTVTVPLATLIADPEQNIYAAPGDTLTLIRQPQTFSVFGATGKNTAITFTQDRLTLSEALAKAGGLLDERADPRAVFLFRYEPIETVRALGQPVAGGARDGVSPVAYRLDLHEAKSYLLAKRFEVHDKDVIFVADAEIRPVYQFFNALSQITGPIETGFIVCQNSKC